MVAFYARSFESYELLSDPSKVRWYATSIQKVGSDQYFTYPLEPCSKEDMAKFHPAVNKQTEDKVNALQAKKELFCLDWRALQFPLQDTWQSGNDYSAIDVALRPCATRVTLWDGSETGGDDSCTWDETEVKEYIGPTFDFVMYHNQMEFAPNEFGERRITKNS